MGLPPGGAIPWPSKYTTPSNRGATRSPLRRPSSLPCRSSESASSGLPSCTARIAPAQSSCARSRHGIANRPRLKGTDRRQRRAARRPLVDAIDYHPAIEDSDVELSDEERALRTRVFDLFVERWPELAPQVARWLGTAFKEDDASVGEIAFVMVSRIRKGIGLVRALRTVPPGDPREVAVLRRHLRFAVGEVVAGAQARRRRPVDLTDMSTMAELAVATPDADIDSSIGLLLDLGAETWEKLCNAGVLRRTDWTEDDRWTVIGMMWGLPCHSISVIRYVEAKAPRAVLDDECASTYGKMRTIRDRGRRLLETLSEELRLDYGLPLSRRQGKVEVNRNER